MVKEGKVGFSFVIVLVVLLTVSVAYNIKLKNQLDKILVQQNIRGTHMAESLDKHDSEYLVFRDGKYYRYKQFNALDIGNYEEAHENIYILKSDNINKQMNMINSSGKLYLYDEEEDNILVYSKISSKSMFINVKIQDDNSS